MPIFKMTKFVNCEWGLKCNFYTLKCTYEQLKWFPNPHAGGGHPLPKHGLWVDARPIVRTPNCPPHVPKRSDTTGTFDEQYRDGSLRSVNCVRSATRCQLTATFQLSAVALVLSRLDYGNSVLIGLPIHLVHRLQSVHNAAARLICRLDASTMM